MRPWLFSFSISFSNDCCKWIGIGLTFCCISFAYSFSSIPTLIAFTVWFSLNSFLNCPFNDLMSGSSLTCFICWSVLSLSTVIPNSFIQSNPSSGFVFFVDISTSRCFCLPFTFTFAIVFPSKFIRLSFTSLYSVSSGCNGVMLLNSDFGIRVTGEPLSLMNLIGRFSTNALSVKNSGPLMLVGCVEWIFCFIEWIVTGAHSSSPALPVSSSCIWYIFLLDRQHFAKWPIFPHFAHFFPLAGHSCCLDHFGAPHLLQSIFLTFAGLSPVSLLVRVFLLLR